MLNEEIFYTDGYRLGLETIAKGATPESVFIGMHELYDSIDRLIDALLKRALQTDVKTDCSKGCAWCCHQPVFANDIEIGYLIDFLRESFSQVRVAEIFEKAAAKNTVVSALPDKEMLNYKSACPLLRDNACMAYAARPMACRIYLSMNIASCKRFFEKPSDKSNYPALLEFPLMAGRMLNQGFIAALSQNGKQVNEYRLEEGLELLS
ncbi:MAG: YkgJ family cysteine cluster protein [Prolixibacteraceae bacterium]|nr:YkgJ family cysteine cluster protein [Prolixibacteraceae bacterium]